MPNKVCDQNGKVAISPKNGATIPVGHGRNKGSLNKITKTAKDNISAVYEGLGGLGGHIAYLKAHPKELAEFYRNVYPRLLPLDVAHSGNEGGPIIVRAIWNGNGG